MTERAARGAFAWLLAVVVLLSGCGIDPALDAEFRGAAAAEMARRPADYVNGEARAFLVRRDGVERGLLWGTIHVGYSDEMVLPRTVRARFYEAADLVVETALDRMPVASVQRIRAAARAADEAADPAGLAGLDAGTRAALDAVVEPREQRRLSLRGLASLVMARSMAVPGGPLPTVGFVDMNLMGFARSQNRPVIGLEPLAMVDPTLSAPNGADAAGMLALALRRGEGLRAMSEWARRAYGRGDVAGLVAVLVGWRAQAADLVRTDRGRGALLTERNAAWVPRLERIFARPGLHFVAVGAGHLVGEDGLVAMLRRRGFEVVGCEGDVC